ncbi:acetyltransferase [Acinetobacter nematophilus]|uniref:Acetyltransferase n=1 Tax=Acinetobacter nematophilus TaxID=2994642 RepID=A0A9X3IIU0_9GAMM|nr:acetyltransferase [Acinetobacter nematophilus]MCX5468609.1 acetyltransferase [Acinetobacter nematophilus]
MLKIRMSRPDESSQVVAIWQSSVDATHHFLSAQDRHDIEKEVIDFFSETPVWLAVDSNDHALGFMFLHDGHMEALFIDAKARGQGVGKLLLSHALKVFPHLSIDVNEQNQQAIGFYQYMGCQITGRSERDGQGREYPLLHLTLSSKNLEDF